MREKKRWVVYLLASVLLLVQSINIAYGTELFSTSKKGTLRVYNAMYSGEPIFIEVNGATEQIAPALGDSPVTIQLWSIPMDYPYVEHLLENDGMMEAHIVEYDVTGGKGTPAVGSDAIDYVIRQRTDKYVIEKQGHYLITEYADDLENDGDYLLERHFVTVGAAAEEVPPVEVSPDATANVTDQKVTVDGEQIKFQLYNINGYNYFKLRDIAQALKDTGSQFEVGWSGANNSITLETGKPYTTVHGELVVHDTGARPAVKSTAKVIINGTTVNLDAYTIDNSNYFQLRELGGALGFTVSFDNASQTVIIESR